MCQCPQEWQPLSTTQGLNLEEMSAAEFICKVGERVEFSQNQSRKNRFSSWICKSEALKVWEASGSLG